MEFVDTHCHPHFDDLLTDAVGVMGRAYKAGVKKMICVGVDLADSRSAIKFAKSHDNVWATAGVHPHEAKNFNSSSKLQLKELLTMPKIVAVGEIGLDYYRLHSTKDEQLAALASQIELSQKLDLPIVFHIRDAWSDFWRVFDQFGKLRGVIHSFTGGPKQLEQALSRGLYTALNGIVTFTKDQALLEAAKQIPLDKLVLETDAPFLLPTGSKNKTCEPGDLRLTAEFLAGLRQENLEAIAEGTTKNAHDLFGLRA